MKTKQKITARSWVPVGNELVEFDSLPPEDRETWADALRLEYLNSMYAGRAVFRLANQAEVRA